MSKYFLKVKVPGYHMWREGESKDAKQNTKRVSQRVFANGLLNKKVTITKIAFAFNELHQLSKIKDWKNVLRLSTIILKRISNHKRVQNMIFFKIHVLTMRILALENDMYGQAFQKHHLYINSLERANKLRSTALLTSKSMSQSDVTKASDFTLRVNDLILRSPYHIETSIAKAETMSYLFTSLIWI